MGLFKKEVFKKDKKGNWKKVKSTIENAPHDYGRWAKSNELEKNSGLKERTYIKFSSTRTGMNYKVTKASTYFGEDEKVVRTLITTSNKLPKNYRG